MTKRLPASAIAARACGVAAALLLAAAASPAAGHDGHAGHAAAETSEETEPAQIKLLDLALVDSDGRPQRLMSDVIEDRIVAINFIYTSCTTVCPVMSAIFAGVQDELGDRLGPDVGLVSISIDPATDVPRRLKRYSERFDAGPGWTFLTGDKSRVDQVLTGLGAFTPEFEDHPSMVLIGDARRGVWRRFYGFASPDSIVAALDELAAGRDHTQDKEQAR